MAMEKRLKAVPPQLFTSNGTSNGQITVADATLFKVKQKVIINANALPNLELEVKRVLDDRVTLSLGPTQGNIDSRQDLSLYTTAATSVIFANEQQRPSVPEQEVERLTYEEEPVIARRVVLVDKVGQKVDTIRDSKGVNRIAVDGMFTAEVDVQVETDIEGVYDPVDNPDPDNIGIIGNERGGADDETSQTQRITAKRGTVDTDTVSVDVSLHDGDGNVYDPKNPLPTSSTYEKFFNLISDSKWLKLANFTSVTPTFSGDDLTLRYMEDDAILGDAVITNYVSLNNWQLTLIRYIANDDGSILQDDDGTPLNLD